MTIYVDHTHLGRHVTGLERITQELFSEAALAPLSVTPVTATGTPQMIARQTFGMPLRLLAAPALLLCPGFPPTPLLRPFASRVIPYIHDIFLLSRRADLNQRARLYMAAPFALALRTYPRFLTNSRDTANKLSGHCRSDAEITLYRPPVRNVFDLASHSRESRPETGPALRLACLGTVEPRKNFMAAAAILDALRARGYSGATLDIVGRPGWGEDWQKLQKCPGVTLHGYQPASKVKDILDRADFLLCTSHEEGLGLPLLEAQYAGLAVVAPDAVIFHEVLDCSGIFIDPSDPVSAADRIAAVVSSPGWRAHRVALGVRNLDRWNMLAASDRSNVIDLITRLAADIARMPANSSPPKRNDTRPASEMPRSPRL